MSRASGLPAISPCASLRLSSRESHSSAGFCCRRLRYSAVVCCVLFNTPTIVRPGFQPASRWRPSSIAIFCLSQQGWEESTHSSAEFVPVRPMSSSQYLQGCASNLRGSRKFWTKAAAAAEIRYWSLLENMAWAPKRSQNLSALSYSVSFCILAWKKLAPQTNPCLSSCTRFCWNRGLKALPSLRMSAAFYLVRRETLPLKGTRSSQPSPRPAGWFFWPSHRRHAGVSYCREDENWYSLLKNRISKSAAACGVSSDRI